MSDAGCGAGARRSPSQNVLRRGEAALEYARRGWPVFPVRADKRPLTDHGSLDATCDPKPAKPEPKRII